MLDCNEILCAAFGRERKIKTENLRWETSIWKDVGTAVTADAPYKRDIQYYSS